MWTITAKEETLPLSTITGFDVEKFVKTGERIEGKRIELEIGVKEFKAYYEHLKRLYNKFGSSNDGIDAILDDKIRQDLHNEATESVLRNTFSPAVMKYYKSQNSGLTGLNFKIRQLINDECAEMMKHSVMANKKNFWIKIKSYQLENGELEQKDISEVDVNTFKSDKEGEGSDQNLSFKLNRNRKDMGEDSNDKSPINRERLRTDTPRAPSVDNY